MPATIRLFLSGIALLTILSGCTASRGNHDGELTDRPFLTAPIWDDGQSEIAFYEVHRTRNQYGEEDDQTFLAGTYLVKHDYDPAAESKAGPDAREKTAAFKYAVFYEFDSGSYQYKRSYVVQARQSDLRPLKSSFASFDWCSNLYREQSFRPNGDVHYLMRSDDYGNQQGVFRYAANTYPAAQLPILVRGLDLAGGSAEFDVVLLDGARVGASAQSEGVDTLDTAAGRIAAERIRVRYDRPVPSPVGEQTDVSETYWRGLDDARLLVRMEGATYRMEIVEHLRAAYWDEDVYERLARVTIRP